MIGSDVELPTILDTVARLVEADAPDYRCAVSLLQDDGRLHLAAAPSLPAAWIAVANEVPVGPDQGSCGAAAWAGKPVIVSDVTRATSWRPWVDDAVANGLRACWAVPITINHGVVGVISVYHAQPHSPAPSEIDDLHAYGQLVAVALAARGNHQPRSTPLPQDAMTGLVNAEHVRDRLHGALVRLGQQPGCLLAVVDLEARRLSDLPSTLGQSASERLVADAVTSLQAVMSVGDTIARVGVDRFLVIAEGLRAETDVVDLAHRLVEVFTGPFGVDGSVVALGAVCGVSVATDGSEDVDALLGEAAMAAGVARESGRGTVTLFDQRLARRAADRLTLELGLVRALRRDELVLHFQPTYSLADQTIIGFEGLVRWQDPEHGLRGPGEFIAVAEDAGIIGPLTRWVLDAACAQAAQWRDDEPDRRLWIAVNLSALQLQDARIIDDVRAALDAHQIPPAMLHLEVTETAVMADAATSVGILRGLKSLGVELAIDDFGTGYSSLAYLKRLPVDALKIDRAFVQGLSSSPEDAAIVEAVLTLARTLGLEVIAEGVENADQLAALQQLGCPLAQGFLWSQPLPAEQAIRLPRRVAATPGDSAAVRTQPSAMSSSQITDVLSVLNHELRSPLSVISLLADMVADASDPQQQVQRAQAIRRQVEVMATLLDSVTTARLVEQGLVSVELRTLNLGELVGRIVADAAPLLRKATAHVVVDDHVLVQGDPSRIQQLLVNLLSNADRYSPAGGRIDVNVAVQAREAVVTVRDEGPGVDAEKAGVIFRKFGRADRTTAGMGLGLFISRGIALAHGGDLRYVSAPGGGAAFQLLLPTHPAAGVGQQHQVSWASPGPL